MMRNWLMAFAVASLCMADVRAQAPTTPAEIENLKLQIEILKKTRESLRAQEELRTAREDLREAREQSADAVARVEDLSSRLEGLQREKATFDETLGAEKVRAEQALKQMRACEADLQKVRRELDGQKQAVMRLEADLGVEKNVSEKSVKQANALHKALAGAKAELSREKNRLEGSIAALAKEKADLAKRLADACAERDAARRSADELGVKVRDGQAALKRQEEAAANRLREESRGRTDAEAEVAHLKRRLAEIDPQLAQARAEVGRLMDRDIVSNLRIEALVHAQMHEWLACLESWKAAVEKGYRPGEDARACIRKAFEAGLEDGGLLPADEASRGLHTLSLATRNERLRAIHAAIQDLIGPEGGSR